MSKNIYFPKNFLSGFTLLEMLISLVLGIFLTSVLMKVYLWQSDINHKISDMVFLDHHGVLAITLLSHEIQHAQKITLTKNPAIKNLSVIMRILTQNHQTKNYFIKNKKFYCKNNADNPIEIISGIDQFNAIIIDAAKIKIKMTIHITAPYGMTENLSKTMNINATNINQRENA